LSEITVDEARPFFALPKQQGPVDPEHLPGWPFRYFSEGGICLCLHEVYGGVWMVHIAADPAFWGRLDGSGKRSLQEAWDVLGAEIIVAWVPKENRAVLSLARRCGFEDMGEMPAKSQTLVMMGWKPCQLD